MQHFCDSLNFEYEFTFFESSWSPCRLCWYAIIGSNRKTLNSPFAKNFDMNLLFLLDFTRISVPPSKYFSFFTMGDRLRLSWNSYKNPTKKFIHIEVLGKTSRYWRFIPVFHLITSSSNHSSPLKSKSVSTIFRIFIILFQIKLWKLKIFFI